MKKSRIIKSAALMALTFCMTVTGGIGNFVATTVKASDSVLSDIKATVPKAVLADVLKPLKVNPGDTVEVVIPMKASNFVIRKPIINVDLSKTPGLTLASDVTYYRKDNQNPNSIPINDVTFVKFSVYIPLNAKKGTYNDIPVTFITTNSFNEYEEVKLDQVSKLTFVIDNPKKGPVFSYLGAESPSEVKASESFSIGTSFSNKGELPAKNVRLTLSGHELAFLLEEGQPVVTAAEILPGQTLQANFDFTAGVSIPTGIVELIFTLEYDNEDGTPAEPQKFKLPVQTIAKEEKKDEPINKPIIQVSNVSYPRHTVSKGMSFDVIYTFTNTSKIDAKNVVIDIKGYSEAGLKPAKAYDKVRLKFLKAGKSVKVRRHFKASENLTNGMKPITAAFTYYSVEDKASTAQVTDEMNIYIDTKEDKQGQNDVNNSVPRLMISKYDTGKDKIMAGKIFHFTFHVLNTHESVAADNIKVTVSSADGNFSIVEGSPSFYISSLKAGETKKLMIPLKVKGDIAANGYDLSVNLDYESLSRETVNGNTNIVKKESKLEEKLKLQVFSNDRPMLSNINVGDGEPPKYGETTSLSFDFNNLGKSPLYNVTAKIKGDFKSVNDILIIGNVNAGEGKSWSMEVVPQEGAAGNGVLTISYEDSNGNVSSYDTEFSKEIMPPETEMPETPDLPNLPKPEEKKDILPLWAFVGIQVILFLVAAMIVRGILIKRYKKKKLKEIENEDETA